MKVYHIEQTQQIPISITDAWEFLSNPKNLKEITPSYMEFKILSNDLPDKIYAGQIISYTVNPLAGVPLKWISEITQVQDPTFFVDEQRSGPYKFWHHQHHLRAIEGGTEMLDIIHYAMPLGPLGRLANKLFVSNQLAAIFEFRRVRLENLFGKM